MSKTKKVVRVALNYVSTIWIDLPIEEVSKFTNVENGQESWDEEEIIELAEEKVSDQDIREADSYLEETFTSVDLEEVEENE